MVVVGCAIGVGEGGFEISELYESSSLSSSLFPLLRFAYNIVNMNINAKKNTLLTWRWLLVITTFFSFFSSPALC